MAWWEVMLRGGHTLHVEADHRPAGRTGLRYWLETYAKTVVYDPVDVVAVKELEQSGNAREGVDLELRPGDTIGS